jgi:hypothetical protein
VISFIYVIGADKAGPVKIGLSVNPDKRLRQLQTGHPARLSLFHTMEVESAKVALMEKIIHKTVRPWRGVGEWFYLSVDDAIAEVEFALIRYGEENIRNYL